MAVAGEMSTVDPISSSTAAAVEVDGDKAQTKESVSPKASNNNNNLSSPSSSTNNNSTKYPNEWSVEELSSWLKNNDFSAYASLFCDQHRIDGAVFLSLTAEDLRSEPLSIKVFGDIRRLRNAIGALNDCCKSAETCDSESNVSSTSSVSSSSLNSEGSKSTRTVNLPTKSKHDRQTTISKRLHNCDKTVADFDTVDHVAGVTLFGETQMSHHHQHHHQHGRINKNGHIIKHSEMKTKSAAPSALKSLKAKPPPSILMRPPSAPCLDELSSDEVVKHHEDDVTSHSDRTNLTFKTDCDQPKQSTARGLPPHQPNVRGKGNGNVNGGHANNTKRQHFREQSASTSTSSMNSDADLGRSGRDYSSSSSTTLSSMSSGVSDEEDSPARRQSQRRRRRTRSIGELKQSMVAYAPPGNGMHAQIVPIVTSAKKFHQQLTADGHFEAAALYHLANGAALGVRSSYRPIEVVAEPGSIGHAIGELPSEDEEEEEEEEVVEYVDEHLEEVAHERSNHRRHHHRHHHHRPHNKYRPDKFKALVAMIYFFLSTWVTAIVMVIVHDRVPNMDKHPPLPDIILDNLPLIPWAFGMCELCAVVLLSIWGLILVFHKHRFILIRRMFSLCGTVFLLRCVTMLITSMSVPGKHLKCEARAYGTWPERIHQAFLIWVGGGLSIQGVRTCGDYMFSGHTVVLTMFNFLITEYTPPSMYYVHTVSWVLNLFGAFFILAGHEHYSIDVFIAFYITTRLFLYYHTLANNRALYQRDRHRTRIWFPLFSYFESGVYGIVPNEYEIPLREELKSVTNFISQWRCHLVTYLTLLIDDGGVGRGERTQKQPQPTKRKIANGVIITSASCSAASSSASSSASASSSELLRRDKVKVQ